MTEAEFWDRFIAEFGVHEYIRVRYREGLKQRELDRESLASEEGDMHSAAGQAKSGNQRPLRSSTRTSDPTPIRLR